MFTMPEPLSNGSISQTSMPISLTIVEHGIYQGYRPDSAVCECRITASHSIFLYHTHHHPRISRIVISALIASSPASVVFMLYFLPHRLQIILFVVHEKGRPQWRIIISKAGIHCGTSSRSSRERASGHRKFVQQAWIISFKTDRISGESVNLAATTCNPSFSKPAATVLARGCVHWLWLLA